MYQILIKKFAWANGNRCPVEQANEWLLANNQHIKWRSTQYLEGNGESLTDEVLIVTVESYHPDVK